ncbi:hypothetical protein E0H39_29640 [Rhizobium leguminosarum bv. viciae]|uniref:hypothetical protein n=1 Tax=Rhizobium leguminosarum TaxID=384 RepID=UPI0010387E82|nr:hypothetical protein [Rhizobium leguminosarum]TBY57981.1 hypothetical protein E0H39_29640 [Rhizobium leguminosarum bv. viciae]
MTARVFRSAARVMHRTFSEDQPATWIRSADNGTFAADPIRVTFALEGIDVDADGVRMATGKPQASVLLSDAIAIEPARAGWKHKDVFRNDGRDKLIVNGVSYDVESCKTLGYAFLQIDLVG